MGPKQGQKMGVNVLLLRGQNLKIRLRHDTDRTLICCRVNFQAVPSIHCRENRDVTHTHTHTHTHTQTKLNYDIDYTSLSRGPSGRSKS